MSGASTSLQKQAFVNFIVELMAGFAPVQARHMFGGWGIFCHGLMLAIVIDDKLYFKVDDESQPCFDQRGLPRFRYEANGRSVTLRYGEAPPEVYDEPTHMAAWAKLGYECAVRQQRNKAGRVRTSKRQAAGESVKPVASFLDMKNLGPKSLAMLASAGIHTESELKRLGAVMAYARTKAVCPKASLNLLWALEGALSGRHWKVVAETERASLLMALEDVQRHLVD